MIYYDEFCNVILFVITDMMLLSYVCNIYDTVKYLFCFTSHCRKVLNWTNQCFLLFICLKIEHNLIIKTELFHNTLFTETATNLHLHPLHPHPPQPLLPLHHLLLLLLLQPQLLNHLLPHHWKWRTFIIIINKYKYFYFMLRLHFVTK